MVFAKDSASINAMGGTELIKNKLEEYLPPELLDNFQIFLSRVEEAYDDTKIRLYYAHDLAEDPATMVLANGGWRNFHKLIFVSNHQMQSFIKKYNIPWDRCIVMLNAIDPITPNGVRSGPIRLGYWSTPHRGLQILIPAFEKLQEKHSDIELDVFSSFKLYGWEDRDEPYKELFEACKKNPKINYHGSVSNQEIRDNLKNLDIFAYPSIWEETSCLCLMEAMASGLLCVHPNLGALYETAAGMTNMYQYLQDPNHHAGLFYHILDNAIQSVREESTQYKLGFQSTYANAFYSWNSRKNQWRVFLESLLNEDRSLPEEMFIFNT
jgi:glycosyltransferase involved in cell wall biosynthesis